MSDAAIVVQGVGKDFGGARPALDGVSLEIAPGEFLALLGHNGAGKTTLMKLILGLTRPTSGHLTVFGGDPAGGEAKALRRHIGFLPENVVFDGAMPGIEVLRFFARLKSIPLRQCEPLLERVGLPLEAFRRPVKTYSKGMRQRLGLAQALLGEPRLLLLDEPTTGLDPSLRRAFFDTLQGLQETGTTIVLSSHILPELQRRCDRAAILREGRMVALGTLPQLRAETGLPVRVRLTTDGPADGLLAFLGNGVAATRINGETIRLECSLEEKMALLSRISASGIALREMEVRPPDLDDLYLHYREERP